MATVYVEAGKPFEELTAREQFDLRLFDAIAQNDRIQARLLIGNSKRDINERFVLVRQKIHELTNPLNLAAFFGNDMMLKFFIECGGDVNLMTGKFDRAPLHIAVLEKRMGCMQVLLTAKAKVDLRDVFGNTACNYAAELGYGHFISLLLRFGANRNIPDSSGKTPLMKAARDNMTGSIHQLLEYVRPLNYLYKCDENGDTAFHFAARNGHWKALRELCRRIEPPESIPNLFNHKGITPLIDAVSISHTDCVRILLDKGADYNFKSDSSKYTALELASRKGCGEIVELFVMDMLRDPSKTLAVFKCNDWDFYEYVRLFCLDSSTKETDNNGQNTKNTLFSLAVQLRSFSVCKLLAQLGYADFSSRTELQLTLQEMTENEEQKEKIISLLELLKQPWSLKHAARAAVRRCLKTNLSQKIKSLSLFPLPATLIPYLQLKEEITLWNLLIRERAVQ